MCLPVELPIIGVFIRRKIVRLIAALLRRHLPSQSYRCEQATHNLQSTVWEDQSRATTLATVHSVGPSAVWR